MRRALALMLAPNALDGEHIAGQTYPEGMHTEVRGHGSDCATEALTCWAVMSPAEGHCGERCAGPVSPLNRA